MPEIKYELIEKIGIVSEGTNGWNKEPMPLACEGEKNIVHYALYKKPWQYDDVTDGEYTVRLNGLEEGTVYSVYDYDKPGTVYEMTGKELMTNGITLTLPDGEKAFIIMFNSQSA